MAKGAKHRKAQSAMDGKGGDSRSTSSYQPHTALPNPATSADPANSSQDTRLPSAQLQGPANAGPGGQHGRTGQPEIAHHIGDRMAGPGPVPGTPVHQGTSLNTPEASAAAPTAEATRARRPAGRRGSRMTGTAVTLRDDPIAGREYPWIQAPYPGAAHARPGDCGEVRFSAETPES